MLRPARRARGRSLPHRSVNFESPTDLVIEHERIFVNPLTGEETFFVVVRNTATGFGLPEEYEVALRRLSI